MAAAVAELTTESAAEVTEFTREDTDATRPVVVAVVPAVVPVAVPVVVPVLVSVFVFVPVSVVVLESEESLAEVVVDVPVVVADCPVDVAVVVLPTPSPTPADTDTDTAPADTDTAPPTMIVSGPGSLEERLVVDVVGVVVLTKGAACLLISLGK